MHTSCCFLALLQFCYVLLCFAMVLLCFAMLLLCFAVFLLFFAMFLLFFATCCYVLARFCYGVIGFLGVRASLADRTIKHMHTGEFRYSAAHLPTLHICMKTQYGVTHQ